MAKTVRYIFTFHDHLFKLVEEYELGGDSAVHYAEDEYGTQEPIQDPADLKQVRKCCESIMRGYRKEMLMPGDKP